MSQDDISTAFSKLRAEIDLIQKSVNEQEVRKQDKKDSLEIK
jgi:hypothetical protein